MNNAKMSVFHTQMFHFWYSMGFLPYLGLDDDGNMAASLVRLLRALEKQQPASDKDGGMFSTQDSTKDIAGADWSIRNIMLDCVDKAETMLSLARPSSTSLDCRLVEISIALTQLLGKAYAEQKAFEAKEQKEKEEEASLSRKPPNVMVPPPTGSRPPPPPPPGLAQPFNHGLPPGSGSGSCPPAPPLLARPEFNSDHTSSGNIYRRTGSNIHTSNYPYLYYHGILNGTTSHPRQTYNFYAPAPASPPRKLVVLKPMHAEYFRAAYDSASVQHNALFDEIRHIAPEATFTYVSTFHPDSFKVVVCCVSGWGLGNCALTLPDDRVGNLDYNQLVSMIMLSGTTLHYTSSPIHKVRMSHAALTAQNVQAPQPGKPSIFGGIVTPGLAQGLVKPPLFRSVPGSFPPAHLAPAGSNLPPHILNLSRSYMPPVRPAWTNPAFRRPGPTGSVGRPALYHPPQPYSLPPGSRYGPKPIQHGVPPWRGGPVPNRKGLQSRKDTKHRNGTRRSIFDHDDDDVSKASKTESGPGETSNASGCSGSEGSALNNGNKSDESGSGSSNDSDSDSDSGSDSDNRSDSSSARRDRRLRRRLSYSSLYTDSVLSDDGNNDNNELVDDEFKDDGEACACLFGKGRRSKKCNSPRCIFDDMSSDELEQSQKYALKIKAKRQRKKAARAARAAEKEKKKAEQEKAEQDKAEMEKKEKDSKKNKKCKLDKEDWEAVSDGLSVDTASDSDSHKDVNVKRESHTQAKLKAIESGSVVSLSDSGSGSGSESESYNAPNTSAAKVDIFAWMKEGKHSKETEEKDKEVKMEKNKNKKDKAKRRGSFVVV